MTTNLIESARHVVEHKQFATIDATTGAIVPTPDSVYNAFDDADKTPDETPETPDNLIILDGFTASMLVQVYEALGDEARSKFEALSPIKCVNVCWKLVAKTR